MKITVIGTGYVGLANAVLLSQFNEVFALDIVEEKVDLINQRISPIQDDYIDSYFKDKELDLTATTNAEEAIVGSEFVFIATPTDYDENSNTFNTKSVRASIENVVKYNPEAHIVIKSTVPVGFTEEMKLAYPTANLLFSPEFLREGKALYDNLYPSRIIMGGTGVKAKEAAELLKEGSLDKNVEVLITNATEAEAIKLFSNTYLAMRVSYFNELDSYAEIKGLDSQSIINGVGLDPRIGDHYNNPSFGYGGYCLPKDTKQMLANYEGVPQTLIKAIVDSNAVRKQHIVDQIMESNPNKVGVYRLTMKSGSDNFRQAAIHDIISAIVDLGVDVIIYEPVIDEESFEGFEVNNNLDKFLVESDIIVANRITDELTNHAEKVYTRDIYNRD